MYMLIPSPFRLISLMPFSSGNHQNVFCIWKSCFCFDFLFCSLDSTYKWNHMVFVFLCLTFHLVIIPSRSIYAVVKGKIVCLFLWSSDIYHNIFIHTSIDGHLGCSHSLAIVHNAVINIGWRNPKQFERRYVPLLVLVVFSKV